MSDPNLHSPAKNETDVYAIHGADPEVLAYAMAKYSRSSLTLRESLREISSQRAEEFLNTFYFQYGHRSIADLAHVAFAIERLSLLAAISLVDEQRWDGQERSTRYQDFRKSGFYTPALESAEESAKYAETISMLFDSYIRVGEGMLGELKEHTARPDDMDEGAYHRTLRARAFDMARYLLPLATNTSLGQITNARTLEGQIARLLGSDYAEVRELGEKLRAAAAGPAWNVNHRAASDLMAAVRGLDQETISWLEGQLLHETRTAPTLVKYTAPSEFERESREVLSQAARELLQGAAIAPMPSDSPNVELVSSLSGKLSLEVELAASLLYPHTHYRYRQIRDAVASLPEQRILELVALGTEHRGRHDELPRAFSAAQGFRFDILMDIGGFRDMHRHRRCTQLLQAYTVAHGYEMPDFPGQPQVSASPAGEVFTAAMGQAFAAYRALCGISEQPLQTPKSSRERGTPASPRMGAFSPAPVPVPQFGEGGLKMTWGNPLPSSGRSGDGVSHPDGCARPAADYVLPLATRCRSLFTMDFAEAVYISELRSTPAGHWSYRNVAWQMYQAVAREHPGLARHFRIRDPHEPVNLLQR